jgi:hypothetical protein
MDGGGTALPLLSAVVPGQGAGEPLEPCCRERSRSTWQGPPGCEQ